MGPLGFSTLFSFSFLFSFGVFSFLFFFFLLSMGWVRVLTLGGSKDVM
jgi:hypothetical protein